MILKAPDVIGVLSANLHSKEGALLLLHDGVAKGEWQLITSRTKLLSKSILIPSPSTSGKGAKSNKNLYVVNTLVLW